MHSLTLQLVACFSAALTTFAQTTGGDVYVTTATVYPPPEANATLLNGTFVYTCPVAPTVFVNFTEYIPVIETTTQPLTVYQTIISTTVVTSVCERILLMFIARVQGGLSVPNCGSYGIALLFQLLIIFSFDVGPGSALYRNHHRGHHRGQHHH